MDVLLISVHSAKKSISNISHRIHISGSSPLVLLLVFYLSRSLERTYGFPDEVEAKKIILRAGFEPATYGSLLSICIHYAAIYSPPISQSNKLIHTFFNAITLFKTNLFFKSKKIVKVLVIAMFMNPTYIQ